MSDNLITNTGSPSVSQLNRVGCVVTAAGEGIRMEGLDKIFLPINGKPLISYAVNIFQNSPLVHQIVLVLNKNNIKAGEELRNKLEWSKVSDICVGGERRQNSVANGISHLKTCQWVIIHDGARPCITDKLIESGLNQALNSGAAIAAIPARETIKVADGYGFISSTPERRDLWIAQTPQIFRTDIITEAHRQAKNQHREATDDAALVEAAGYRVKIYMGSYDNIKITTPRDLSLAGNILKQGKEPLP
ncbi:MAG: 2-C-methyl-D-erythritol 4-phosphate cytidylyltransferase [Dehalococcoidia bacterium]|nr:2-C-methyl-D-erythritol 4-phosphate cytidylyltransferase [Dehalococcoidia bacterium]